MPSDAFCATQMGQPVWDIVSLPFLALRMGPERTVRALQGNVDPSFMALLVAEAGCFVCCQQAAYRGRQDSQAGNPTSSQAHFDACTCPASALRSIASRGTPNGSPAALSHNRFRERLPNAARELCPEMRNSASFWHHPSIDGCSAILSLKCCPNGGSMTCCLSR